MKFYGWKLLHTENISQNVKPWYEKSLLPNWNSGSNLFLESSYLKVRYLSGMSFCETISTKLIFAANREIKFFERNWDQLNRKNVFHKVLFFWFLCVFLLRLSGCTVHWMKSVRIWSFSNPYFPVFGLNTDQKNSVFFCI